MSGGERERELRRRLAAYVERQTDRATRYDRLASAVADGRQGATLAPDELPAVEPVAHDIGGHPVTIVIAVFNAANELHRCIWSVAQNTTVPATLLLIDDASTDPHVDDVLTWAARLENVRILRNVTNLGYPATVNRALRATDGDLVLLNSDTEVGPRWLEQLIDAAYRDPATATVTPLSDNAGAFSAPVIDVANPLGEIGVDAAARLVSGQPDAIRPASPTGNGFCMYVKRAALDAVGEFDAASFPRGYGEETDFCVRAAALGWRHVVDDRTFVHHVRMASFGDAKQSLVIRARKRMDELHPGYKDQVSEFIADPAMAAARDRVATALARGRREGPARPRVLFVIHEGGGGAVATNRDLISTLSGEYECFCFSSDRRVLRLAQIEGTDSELLHEFELERPLLLGDFSRSDYRAAFSAALERTAPELVHIRHLFKHTFDPPQVATAHRIPVVMSLHDHYFICPTIHLLDDRGRYCGGDCTPGPGVCRTVRAGTLPPLKHSFVHQWREEAQSAMARVDAFVTTSDYTRDIHRRLLAVTRERPFELIEHGRDLMQATGLATAPVPGGPVRIVIPGNLDRHKGADLLAAMVERDHDRRLELHFLGDVPERYRGLGSVHGAYERDELAARVRAIRPSFVGVFSVTGESYSHAITEAWAAGVPVLVTDLGAQAARVRAHGGGFEIRHDDPASALEDVLAAADDLHAYEAQAARATVAGVPSVAEMGAQYAGLYRDVIDRRRPVAAPDGSIANPLRRGAWRLDALVASAGAGAGLGGRLLDPSVGWKLRVAVREPDVESSDAEIVFVEQGAVPAAAAGRLVARARARGQALVFAGERSIEAQADRMLLEEADLAIASSPDLAQGYCRLSGEVVVVGDTSDARLLLGVLGRSLAVARAGARGSSDPPIEAPVETPAIADAG